MASKNHKRYKVRKRNTVKHQPKRLFDDPPILIHDFSELIGLENDICRIEVDEDMSCAWVKQKDPNADDDPVWWKHDIYLSTHTFYKSHYQGMTKILRRLGFNIQLENWDGETVYCEI